MEGKGEDRSDDDNNDKNKNKNNVSAQTLLRSNNDSFYGYLKKYNPRDKAQSRFCVIDKGTFYYYRDAESPRPKGHFQLEGYQAHVEKTSHQPNTFKLEHRVTPHIRSYKFSCVSEKEQSNWVDYINKHVIQCFPVSLYGDEKDEFYDYVPGEVLDTLSREHKRKTEQENDIGSSGSSTQSMDTGETPEVPARTLRMNREYDMKCSLNQENRQSKHGYGTIVDNQGNMKGLDYVCMDFLRQNANMGEDGYVKMNSINAELSASADSNKAEDPYVAVIDDHNCDSDGNSSDEDIPVTVGGIIKAHQTLQKNKTEPNSDMNELHNIHEEITSIHLISQQSRTNRVPEVLPVSPLEAVYPPKIGSPSPTKAKRSGTLPLTPESPIVMKENRSSTLPILPPDIPYVPKENRSWTLPNMRDAIPPPIPERSPIVEVPVLENLDDNAILPSSCIQANIQKEQCSNLLFPHEVGTYLVRTERQDGKDALAILAEKNPPRVKHFIVFESAGGKRYLHKNDPKFEMLQELIRYYYYNPLPQTEIRLIKPLSSILLNTVE